MKNRVSKEQWRRGDRARLVVCLSLTLALASVLVGGCGRKKAAEEEAAAKTGVVEEVSLRTQAASQVGAEGADVVQDEAALAAAEAATEKAEIERILASLPPSARAEMEKWLKEVEAAESEEGDTPETDDKMPKWFEPNQETRECVEKAQRALRMDLPEDEKLAAIAELEGIDHPIVLETVAMALDEASVDIREAALDAIMEIADPVVVPVVVKALDDEDPEIREYALDALMDVDDPSVNQALMKALDDENLDVRDNAVDTMLYIESPSILKSLGKAMTDADIDIREKAIITIEDIEHPHSVDILIEKGLLNDDEDIREDALDSIEFITDKEFKDYREARDWWDRNRDTFEFEE